ncbi:hypothetical protein FI667_g2545, partial [Globisporangium splendens]
MILYGISVSIFLPGKIERKPDRFKAPNLAVEAPSTCDAAAANFVDGLRAGYFTITNSWSGYFTRMLANGVAPRKNSGIEILLIFFVAGFKVLEAVFFEHRLSLNKKETSAVRSTAAASAI